MDKFVIIDGNNLMYRAFFALPQLSNFEGEISNAVFGFANMLVKIIKEINPKYMAVTFDISKHNFRHERFADYKGTRKPTPDELKSQFPIVKEMLKKMNVCVVEMEGLEADDLMGCLSRKFDTENIIVSADRDAFQLINDNTSIMFPKKGITETIILDNKNLKEYYGVEASQVIDLKSLMGDSSDNIPGVSGVGEKTALNLINTYKTLDGVYANIEEISGKLKEKLMTDKDNAYLSQYLATIVTDRELDYTLNDFEYDFPFNRDVYDICKRYQFNSILKKTELFESDVTLQTLNTEIEVVEDLQTLRNLTEKLNDCKEFVFYLSENDVAIYLDKEYLVKCGTDLLSAGLDFQEFLNEMKPILENENIQKIVFDTKTLMHFLYKFNILLKGVAFDILIARYLINSNAKFNVNLKDVLDECGIDTSSWAYGLKTIKDKYYSRMEKMGLMQVFLGIELPLVNVLFDMEIQGFKLDKAELEELASKYKKELVELEQEIYLTAGAEFNINSPKQLSEILFDKLDLNIPSNKKKSTNIEILNEIEHKHPVVSLIIRHRAISKLNSTYVIGFLELLDKDDKIHTVFNQTLTSTGRLSSSEPNLQNIPVRTEEGRNLRKVFIPSHKDGFIVSADYSQIELRLLASFSGDERLIAAFNSGKDIHAATASEIFGVDIEDVTSDIRRKAKAINFGIVYGISDYGLSQNIGSTRKEANEYIKKYFERYPDIEKYMQNNVDNCRENGYIKTEFGRIRPIPEINSNNFNLRTFGERAAMNMPLQGSASDIIKIAMCQVFDTFNKLKLKSKIIVQVHDELVIDCYPNELEQVKEILKNTMENVVDLPVKLTVNIESGKTWFEAK